MAFGTLALVAHHVAEALKEAEARSISRDVVARCLLSEAIRLDEDAPLVFIRP